MNSNARMRPIISLLLVFFLFAPVALRTLHVAGLSSKKLHLEKTSGTSPKSEMQGLFEEKEKEEKSSHSHVALSASVQLALFCADPYFHQLRNSAFFHSFSNRTPVFLAVRSIRI